MKNVEVVPHDPRWRDAFEAEARDVAAALGENAVAVHHVGSTSIPGIYAKPIIDLLVELGDLGAADARGPAMESLGYQVMGEYGISGRRYFRKDGPEGVRTHHVHAFRAGSNEVVRHLAFRDYMIAHPADAQRYSELKRKLAREHPRDVDAYMDGKDGFIKEMDRRAAAWRASRSDEHADGAYEPVLGLRQGAVRLAPHTARWAELYREEEARLRTALEGVLIDIQHFGSTSIPGIHAKPILDILVAVRRRDDVLERRPRLLALGYGYVPGAGVPGHHVFGKGQPRTHLLHVVEHASRNWTENLWFRDRLRADPALAAEYDALKLRLAEAHPDNRARYTEEKSAFVQRIRQQAPVEPPVSMFRDE